MSATSPLSPLSPEELTDPTARTVVTAMRDGDRDAFYGAFAEGAALSDDGSLRDLRTWAECEVFTAHGRLEIREERQNGRYLLGRFHSDRGDLPAAFWHFQISGGKVTRMDVGQAP